MVNKTAQKQALVNSYPMLTPSERLEIWERVRGIWKNKKPDPIKVLKKIRKEWDRKLAR